MKSRLFPAFAVLLAATLSSAVSPLTAAAPAPPTPPGNVTTTPPATSGESVVVPEVPDTSVAPPSNDIGTITNGTTSPGAPVLTRPPSRPSTRPSISFTNRSTNVRTGAVNKPQAQALPAPLRDRLLELIDRPHTYRPQGVYPPLRGSRQLTGFYLLNPSGAGSTNTVDSNAVSTAINQRGRTSTNTEPLGVVRVFQFSSANGTNATATSTSSNPEAFTDVASLPAPQNASSHFEGWLVHDLIIPSAAPAVNGAAAPGSMTDDDATALAVLGTGNNVPGGTLTIDGNAPSSVGQATTNGSTPGQVSGAPNTVSLYLSAGSLLPLQRSDAHAYKTINPQTSWVYLPGLTNLPASGASTGSSTNGAALPPATNVSTAASGLIPSGVAREILLDVYVRKASFEPSVTDVNQRLSDAYKAQVAKVDSNQDGMISANEAEAATGTVFLDANAFNRFVVSEQDHGQAPGRTLLQGTLQPLTEPVPTTGADATQE